ncbi:MAG: CCA tRNA nucleotidyltransferase [Candidatus Altiarchaeales archaeon]|nr:MAG: CCA tRNA nucleotidyltransferase [Candidatus Altiarchaeales archaeon]
MKGLLDSILKEIRPTEDESKREERIIKEIIERLKRFEIEPILVGSVAKKTDLKGDKDIDIFIMFDENTKKETLEKRGLEIGRKIFEELNARYEIDYAEHPYTIGFYKGYNIEIVPCYKTKKVKSAVDRTPHHTEYIKRKLRQNKKLRDQILLLKQFMKGIGVYGAEAKIEGFSGYLIELLVINYGSFKNVLEAAKDWRFGEIIDPENLWNKNKGIKHLFPDANLIIIDPVDRYRNAAAAVSRQSVGKFKIKADEFLKNPNRNFFFPPERKPPSIEEIKRAMLSRGTKFILLKFIHPKININSLYSQLRKTIRSVGNSIKKKGFRIMKSDFWTDEKNLSILLFEMEVWKLPMIERRRGPPVDKDKIDQNRFLKKYKNRTYLDDGRWVADVKREITDVDELLKIIIEERRGFGKNLRDETKIEIKEDDEILDIRDKKFLLFLQDFLLIFI